MDKDDTEYQDENIQEQDEQEILVAKRNEKKSEPIKNKHTPSALAIFTVITLLSASGIYFCRDKIVNVAQKIKQTPEVVASTEDKTEIKIEGGSKTTFIGFGRNYLYCTKDGIKYFDGDQNEKWNSTYTMTSPSVVNNGSYTAVAEAQGRSVKVYSEAGEVYSLSVDGTVVQISINSNGGTGLILKTNSGYKVQVYDEKGKLIMERFDEKKGVYPIAVDVSSDEKILVVSYLDTTDIEIVSKILFFYTGNDDTKKTEAGDFFASVEKVGEIVPAIKYIDNGIFTAVGDTTIFAMDSSGKELWNNKNTNKIDGIAFYGSYLVMALGDSLPGEEGAENGTVRILNTVGNQSIDYCVGKSISYLKAYKNGIVAGSNRDFTALSYSGKRLWDYTTTQDINDIIIMNSSNSVLCVRNNSADIININ